LIVSIIQVDLVGFELKAANAWPPPQLAAESTGERELVRKDCLRHPMRL
jgi:hypothetical protein